MSAAIIIALILAVVVGISLGLLGSGGSIVILPVFVYVLGVSAQQAVGMSLAVVGATSLFGALLRLRQGQSDLKATLMFSASGMVGAYFGASLTHLVSQRVLMLIFSGLMLVVGSAMFFEKPKATDAPKAGNLRLLVAGTGVGILTGFLGVGGGFLIVPALVLFASIDLKKAIGASLAIIAFNSAAGLLGHWQQLEIDWKLTGLILLAALVGMAIGNSISIKVPEKKLKQSFAGFVVTVGIVIASINIYGLMQ